MAECVTSEGQHFFREQKKHCLHVSSVLAGVIVGSALQYFTPFSRSREQEPDAIYEKDGTVNSSNSSLLLCYCTYVK